MNGKMKVLIGLVTVALAFSLIGGGTWSALTDQETVDGAYEEGNINLEVVSNSEVMELGTFEPAETRTATFQLTNEGTLGIKDVWMSTVAEDFVDQGGVNLVDDFLAQYQVVITTTDNDSGAAGDEVFRGSLKQLTETEVALVKNDNGDEHDGIPKNSSGETVKVEVTFNTDPLDRYDGDSAVLDFRFVATQWDGIDVFGQNDGYIEENENANPHDQ